MIMSYRPLSAVLGVQLCCPLRVFSALVSCFPQSLNGCTTRLCNLKKKTRWSHLKTLLEQRRMATWFPGIFSSHAPGEGSGGPRIPIKLKSCDPVAWFGNIPRRSGLRIFLTSPGVFCYNYWNNGIFDSWIVLDGLWHWSKKSEESKPPRPTF